jgi:glyoxylase-like metal-dependent hydrolase (beta-lactamase superfamily II)
MASPLPHLQSRKVGSLNVHAIQAGGLRLDGGAMFGVVPKPLWERQIPADDRNRIALGMRCLLVDHPSGLVLIDTGLGNKENEKFIDIYGVENAGRGGRTALEDGLASLGIRPEDISLVINTHLHFDHGGGNTFRDEAGVIRPTFPNARYVVQRGEFDYATHTNERTAASYFNPNFVPLCDAGVLDLIEGEREIVEGIRVIASPGHVPFHQSVVIESDDETALFLADVMPTSAHVPLPWIMGYDVEPLVTLESKRRILAQAAEREWLMIFEHDATVPWGRVRHDGKGYRLAGPDLP